LNHEKDFMNGFLILGFALFITGFLTGMLAIAVLHAPSDLTTLGTIIFTLGFVTGVLIAAFALVLVRRRRRQKSEKPNSSHT